MKTRAAYGSVQQVARGRWRVRWWADMKDGRGYRRCSATVRGTRRDACAYLARMQAAHDGDGPSMTVGEVYARWYLPYCEERQAPATLTATRSIWSAHVAPRWAEVGAPDVRPLGIQEWLDQMPTKVVAANALRVLGAVMEYAQRYELVQANPCRVAYVMPTGERSRDKGVYKLSEVAAIAGALEDDALFCLFCLCALGSCRVGEALGTLAADVRRVSAENGMVCAVVPIHQQARADGAVSPILKTAQSARSVVVPEPWSARFLAVAASRVDEGREYLVDNGVDRPLDRTTLSELWSAECARMGRERHPLGNLRNSWRTFMEWELRVPPDKLEKMMGHKGKSVTAKHYNRPDEDVFVDAVSRAFRDNLGRVENKNRA